MFVPVLNQASVAICHWVNSPGDDVNLAVSIERQLRGLDPNDEADLDVIEEVICVIKDEIEEAVRERVGAAFKCLLGNLAAAALDDVDFEGVARRLAADFYN